MVNLAINPHSKKGRAALAEAEKARVRHIHRITRKDPLATCVKAGLWQWVQQYKPVPWWHHRRLKWRLKCLARKVSGVVAGNWSR